ncbi:MAG: tRNA 5-methoxyuridine(34)/uridine 5-oxyacetic acid(34) synthase CmoB [Oligoflexales bacterium]
MLVFPDQAEQLCRQRATHFSQNCPLEMSPVIEALQLPQGYWHINTQGAVCVDFTEELSADHSNLLEQALKSIIPWKKGPFRIDGHDIDAEWRSELKWDRLLPHIHPLENKDVLDIGCHNGYYMYRIAEHKPASITGLEPVNRHWHTFRFLNHIASIENARFSTLGVEHCKWFEKTFDTIFCLGILYHHTDPVGLLKQLKTSLKPGSQILIDCQGIPGNHSSALVPSGRYATTKGVWFLPTQSCLENWLRRSGFRNIECVYAQPLSTNEQRATEWAPIKSLKDFLINDKTVEGYPAPWRFYFTAMR